MIKWLILLKLLTLHPDGWMIIFNIENVYFSNMVSQTYPSLPEINKTNTSHTEVAFLDLHLSISYVIVSTKIHDKRDDFDFEIGNF